MLRLARLTDYGIVLLTSFAADDDAHSRNARELASLVHLPTPVVSKILKSLARSGILASQRGARGGYRLARPAGSITVSEIIAALEGPIAMTECTSGSCAHELTCAVRSNWQLINGAVQVALDQLTLADMARPMSNERLLSLRAAPAARRAAGCTETALEPA